MTPRNIYVVGGSDGYANWMQGELVDSMGKADLVVFTGGEDVTPALYNRKQHPDTYNNIRRDTLEMRAFDEAKGMGKKLIGICRGSQFLCVMAGGSLIQDQDNPAMYHDIITSTGNKYVMSSTHHQAQLPWGLDRNEYEILAWTKGISHHHDGDAPGIEMVYPAAPCLGREVEIASYPLIKALAIQGHPEMMMSKGHLSRAVAESIGYVRNLLDNHMKEAS